MNKKIREIEDYVKIKTANVVAHDFTHVDRVRNWALKIARAESYDDLVKVEAAALLHDIGRGFKGQDADHGSIGAAKARVFLEKNKFFNTEDIDCICMAITNHNRDFGDQPLINIIRDADKLDMLGAIGLARGFTSQASWPVYNPQNIKGKAWQKDFLYFKRRFVNKLNTGDYLVDQLNFQISAYQLLKTKTAKKIAKPLVKFMQDYIIQLEKEITMKID
ncbi:HD domain-containing protein [Patescibacteria group bacterium]